MKLVLSLTLLSLIFPVLNAYTIRNDSLFISVSLAKSDRLTLQSDGTIVLMEKDGMLQYSGSGRIELCADSTFAPTVYRIMIPASDSTAVESISYDRIRWQNRMLMWKETPMVLMDEVFQDHESAQAWIRQHSLAEAAVYKQADPEATVCLRSGGEDFFLHLPVVISSPANLRINETKYEYKGTFELSADNGDLLLNAVVDLEDYLKGVVPNEIGNTAPPEALKAQTIAARTHALSLLLNGRHRQDGFDLCNTTHCQVYRGLYQTNANVVAAVDSTKNMVLSFQNELATTTYHSSCGGRTDSSAKIWNGSSLPYLSGVTCISEADTLDLTVEEDARAWLGSEVVTDGMQSWEKASLGWERSISMAQLAANLELKYITDIDIVERGNSGRILKMKITGDKIKTLSGESNIRKAFGGLPSSFFTSSFSPENGNPVTATLVINGRGSGHGVGMCQVGALRMSRTGSSYTEILSHYYPGTEIIPMSRMHE